MQRPNETQYAAVERIIDAYTRAYGTGGTDQHRRRAALAAYAVFSGQLAGIPDEYGPACREIELSPAAAREAAEQATSEVRKSTAAVLAEYDINLVENPERERMEIHISAEVAEELEIPVGVWLHESELVTDEFESQGDDTQTGDDATEVPEPADDDFDFISQDEDDEEADEEEFTEEEIREFDRRAALDQRTVKQLRSIASDCGVEIKHGAKKEEIIEAVIEANVDLDTFNASLNNHPVGV